MDYLPLIASYVVFMAGGLWLGILVFRPRKIQIAVRIVLGVILVGLAAAAYPVNRLISDATLPGEWRDALIGQKASGEVILVSAAVNQGGSFGWSTFRLSAFDAASGQSLGTATTDAPWTLITTTPDRVWVVSTSEGLQARSLPGLRVLIDENSLAKSEPRIGTSLDRNQIRYLVNQKLIRLSLFNGRVLGLDPQTGALQNLEVETAPLPTQTLGQPKSGASPNEEANLAAIIAKRQPPLFDVRLVTDWLGSQPLESLGTRGRTITYRESREPQEPLRIGAIDTNGVLVWTNSLAGAESPIKVKASHAYQNLIILMTSKTIRAVEAATGQEAWAGRF